MSDYYFDLSNIKIEDNVSFVIRKNRKPSYKYGQLYAIIDSMKVGQSIVVPCNNIRRLMAAVHSYYSDQETTIAFRTVGDPNAIRIFRIENKLNTLRKSQLASNKILQELKTNE